MGIFCKPIIFTDFFIEIFTSNRLKSSLLQLIHAGGQLSRQQGAPRPGGPLGFSPWKVITIQPGKKKRNDIEMHHVLMVTLWLFKSSAWEMAHLIEVYLLKMVIFHGYVK